MKKFLSFLLTVTLFQSFSPYAKADEQFGNQVLAYLAHLLGAEPSPSVRQGKSSTGEKCVVAVTFIQAIPGIDITIQTQAARANFRALTRQIWGPGPSEDGMKIFATYFDAERERSVTNTLELKTDQGKVSAIRISEEAGNVLDCLL